MIITQHPYIGVDGVVRENLVKTYSDEGYYLIQNETGRKYRIAIDAYPCKFTYRESEEKAPPISKTYPRGKSR